MKKTFFSFIIFVLLIASCKTPQNTTGATTPVNDTITDNTFRKLMKDKELYAAVTELVPLDTAYLAKDTLHILTQKIRGCNADNFKLLWNGTMMKSLPPQTSIKLFQQVDAECKEQHRFHLTYNIIPLRLKQDSTSVKIDSVKKATLLRIGGYKNMVKYEF